jgi:hypothetical protein
MNGDAPDTPAPLPPRKGRIVLAYSTLTMLGFVAAVYATRILVVTPDPLTPLPFSRELWHFTQVGILYGALVGVSQWGVIRMWSRHMMSVREGLPPRPRARDGAAWIVVTTAGYIASTVASLIYVWSIKEHLNALAGLPIYLHDALQGCVIGLSQWLYLRRCVPGAARWIAFSAAGEILSSQAGYVPVEFPFSTAAIGVVFGLVQGVCLARLKPGPIAAPSAPGINPVEMNSPRA